MRPEPDNDAAIVARIGDVDDGPLKDDNGPHANVEAEVYKVALAERPQLYTTKSADSSRVRTYILRRRGLTLARRSGRENRSP
jgi:hypothetical protein